MKEGWPARAHQLARANTTERLVSGLLDNSLVLYLMAFAARRAWMVLNSDVTHLVRRSH